MAVPLLPLFPLPLVAFPGTALPLHIFEERYKEMMADVQQASGEFGIVLAKDEGIVNIGCTATVERVVKRYSDGRLDLIALGRRRFRIESLDDDKSYLRAAIEYVSDEEADAPADLKARALAASERLREVEPEAATGLAAPTSVLSYQLGQYVSDVDKRQTLLALTSEVERLRYLVSMLPGYTAERERILLAKRVAPLNGHAKHVQDI